MTYIKRYKDFLVLENETTPLTFDDILSAYCDPKEFSDYKSKFIITKFLEYFIFINKDSRKPNIETLNYYSPKIFTEENINKMRNYKNSDWIKAIDIKLPQFVINYPNLITILLQQMGEFKAKDKIGMMTTNIKIFKLISAELNALLPKEINFHFTYAGLTEITDKNFLKLISFYKDKLFNKEKFELYKTKLFGMTDYSDVTEQKFIDYLKDKGIPSRKANYEEDVKGIDVIDDKGVTYQVKAPSQLKVYKSGYFIPKANQLDIRKIKKADKLVLFSDNKFHIVDTDNITLKQSQSGLFIGTIF